MSDLRLTVTTDQGELLDMVTLTREEFEAAQRNSVAATALLDSLDIGSES